MGVPEAHARPRRQHHLLTKQTHFPSSSSWLVRSVSLRFLSPIALLAMYVSIHLGIRVVGIGSNEISKVRPGVTFMISEPCACRHATGRVEALETSSSRIEQEITRLLAMMEERPDPGNPKSWPKFSLRVDRHMSEYLTSGKRTRLAFLSDSLRVWSLLKVARGFTRGAFEVKPFPETISMLRSSEGRVNNSGRKVTLFPVKKWKTGRK